MSGMSGRQHRWFWPSYVAVVLVLSFSVAWTIFQVIQLQDRADQAEEAVDVLSERAPRMPEAWTFRIDDQVVLHCQVAGEHEGTWVCRTEQP